VEPLEFLQLASTQTFKAWAAFFVDA